MSLSHKLRLAIEICEGVEYAHLTASSIAISKPANIYITESGGAKILDFGLARLADVPADAAATCTWAR